MLQVGRTLIGVDVWWASPCHSRAIGHTAPAKQSVVDGRTARENQLKQTKMSDKAVERDRADDVTRWPPMPKSDMRFMPLVSRALTLIRRHPHWGLQTVIEKIRSENGLDEDEVGELRVLVRDAIAMGANEMSLK